MRKTIFKKLEAKGLIANYNRFRKNLPPKLPKSVFIWDETLREGKQAPTVFLTYVEKVKLVKMMDEVGVSVINVGFPGFSEEEKNTVKRISNESLKQATLAASARAVKDDISACLGYGIQEVSIFAPFNELNLRQLLRTTKEELQEEIVNCIEYAKRHGLTVDFVLEDASRTPLQDILRVFEAAVRAGVDRLVIADTVGFLRPLSTRYLISHVRRGLSQLVKRNVPFSVRCHNDFGLATANTLAAVEEGVTHPQTCIAGFGERAGLASLEEVVTALELLYSIDTGIEVKKLYRLSQLAEKSFALPLQFHKPIVGEDAFSHASDKHIHGMLAHPLIYEPFPPKMVGRETTFFLGGQTGKHLIQNRLALAGIETTPRQVDEIVMKVRKNEANLDKGERLMTFYQIKKLLRELRKGLTEEDFWRIVEQVTGQKPTLVQNIRK